MRLKSIAAAAAAVFAAAVIASCFGGASPNSPEGVAKLYMKALLKDDRDKAALYSKVIDHPKVVKWNPGSAKPVVVNEGSLDVFRDDYLKDMDYEKEMRAMKQATPTPSSVYRQKELEGLMSDINSRYAILLALRDAGVMPLFLNGKRFAELTGSYKAQMVDVPFQGTLQVRQSKTVDGAFVVSVARVEIGKDHDSGWKVFGIMDSKGTYYNFGQ